MQDVQEPLRSMSRPAALARRQVAQSLAEPLLRLKNVVAAASVVALGCAMLEISPANRELMARVFEATGYTGAQLVLAAAGFYLALLAAYYLAEPAPRVSKSVRFWQIAGEFACAPGRRIREGLDPEDRLALLSTLLKTFFAPLMVLALIADCNNLFLNGVAIAESWASSPSVLADFVARHGFPLGLQLIFAVDVSVFTVGYLVELPVLRNEIRSVDPTLLGWAAALICYTPFNLLAVPIIGWESMQYPQFDNPTIHVVLNSLLLALMAVYAWASVALGFKASNLTHRGIIAGGPYRFVRHPAYVCKNMAWWIGSIPVAIAAFQTSLLGGVQVLASVAGWSLIYVFRALTEEDHLRRVDGDYARYATQVRYRFIPGVL